MPRLSLDARNRVISLYSQGYTVPDIYDRFVEEKVEISIRAIYNLVRKHQTTGSVKDLPRRK